MGGVASHNDRAVSAESRLRHSRTTGVAIVVIGPTCQWRKLNWGASPAASPGRKQQFRAREGRGVARAAASNGKNRSGEVTTRANRQP